MWKAAGGKQTPLYQKDSKKERCGRKGVRTKANHFANGVIRQNATLGGGCFSARWTAYHVGNRLAKKTGARKKKKEHELVFARLELVGDKQKGTGEKISKKKQKTGEKMADELGGKEESENVIVNSLSEAVVLMKLNQERGAPIKSFGEEARRS